MPRPGNIPSTDYVRSHTTSDDMMCQPTTFDSVLGSGGSTDTVGENHLVPSDPKMLANNLDGKPEF
jgi:hypothetical protein